MCAGKIRHAGGAVVDHGEASVRQRSIVQQGKAGVGRGEYVDARAGQQIGERGRRARGPEHLAGEAPAGQRGRIAMHDADAQAADIGDEVHGQPGKARAGGRRAGSDAAQFAQDRVRAHHHVVADPNRIGAAASGADIGGTGDFGFDIAAQRAMGRDRRSIGGEPIVGRRRTSGSRRCRRWQRGRARPPPAARSPAPPRGFRRGHPDVEDVGGKIRPPGEHRRIVG